MRKAIVTALLSVAFTVVPAGIAAAGGGYGSQPGYPVSQSHTCDFGHGAFGYYGENHNVHDVGVNYPGRNGEPGAANPHAPNPTAPYTTGQSNSDYSASCN